MDLLDDQPNLLDVRLALNHYTTEITPAERLELLVTNNYVPPRLLETVLQYRGSAETHCQEGLEFLAGRAHCRRRPLEFYAANTTTRL